MLSEMISQPHSTYVPHTEVPFIWPALNKRAESDMPDEAPGKMLIIVT